MDFLSDTQTWNAEIPNSVLRMQQQVVDELKPKHKAKVEQLRFAMKDVLKHRHNDYFLLRWLKVRKFDVGQAEKTLRANLKWREEMQMDRVSEVFQPAEVLRKYFPLGLSGQAKSGQLVWIIPAGSLDVRGMVYSAKLSDIIKYSVCVFEYMERMAHIQSEKMKKLVDKHILIMDHEGFRIQDYLWKTALQTNIFIAKQLVANYPDILEITYAINVPRVYSIFYTIVKPFLSEEYRKQFKVFGKDSWKEELLKAIDADQIPKHWGGTRVDDIDGNPYCSSKIGMAGPVPKSYYAALSRREALENSSFESTTIEARDSFAIEFMVDTPGSTLTWCFGTEEGDIAFGIKYKDPNSGSETEIFPIERRECQFVPEEGTMVCEQPGQYILSLVNNYSWLKSKKVYYDIQVVPPQTTEDKEN